MQAVAVRWWEWALGYSGIFSEQLVSTWRWLFKKYDSQCGEKVDPYSSGWMVENCIKVLGVL